MKWIFLIFLLVLTPALAGFLRSRPNYLPHACFAIGASIYFLDPWLYVAPVSWPAWPGPIKGMEVSLIDAIAAAVIYATANGVRSPLALKAGLGLYAAALVISTAMAAAQQSVWPSLFYLFQFARAILVFIAVKRATAMYPSVPVAIIAGLGVGILYNCVVAVGQYLGGDIQAGGRLGHQNTLGLTMHFATMPAFALLLAGRRNLLAGSIVVVGAIAAWVGGSRATIGLFAIGLGLVTLLSIRHRMTGRKGAFAALAAAALAVAAPAMVWAVERRSEDARQSSNRERDAFKTAAMMIISDYPLGVGANQYVPVANVGGYSDRAGVAWNQGNRSAPVHNAYYLVTAELSLLGLLGMLTVLGAIIFEGLRSFRRLTGERADLVIGLTATTVVVAVHHYFEWLYMTFYIHYLTALSMGALVGLTRPAQRVAERPARLVARSPKQTPAPVPSGSPIF